jgi:tRNA-splicing ligase RtcB (3'-phosphate/5'-hydroxy nucleic acid ligase)
MAVSSTHRVTDKLWSWASIAEENTMAQARTASEMPFVRPYLALMPDAHLGKGATVGSVIPTVGAIMPAAVGVDIGCGMIALLTQFTREQVAERGTLATLRGAIERSIPLSAGHYNTSISATATARIAHLEAIAPRDYTQTAGRRDWRLQLGTLGSGNHFIEVTVDELDRVWLFLHSGSRGIGNRIATEHIAQAQRETAVGLPDRDLAYLTEGTPTFDAYLADLNWAQEFALLNREEMMDRVARQTSEFMGEPVVERERINCHHNFTRREEHFGNMVWLSRKGAIQAEAGQLGLVPGSMGTASYVIEGRGNAAAFSSSPHGAGRNLSRNAARKRFSVEDLREAMRGIEYRDTDAFLDEHPLAYKDIDIVMRDAAELVTIKHTLHQILNVKGD